MSRRHSAPVAASGFVLFALAACASAQSGVEVGQTGYATLLEAPASPSAASSAPQAEAPHERIARERGVSREEAESLMNPDEAATRDAMALDRRLQVAEAGNYVGTRIVRDPEPRFAFQFRRDAVAALARHTRDPRFVAVEGGVPREELQPLFQEWWARFEPHRVLGGGSVMEFDGVVQFDMTIDRAGFEAIAARQDWTIPERVRLSFPPSPNPRSVDPVLAPQVRVFAREDRVPAIVLSAALSGRLILRDGCFRLGEHGEGEPLVLFGRDVELRRDDEGRMAFFDPHGGRAARVGERVVWSGPRGVNEADAGVQALRAACGDDPIVAVGEPISEQVFEAQAAAARARPSP